MAKSMTGFGRCDKKINNFEITAEIKSVNHRYADYNIKIPRHYSFLEEEIKKFVSKKVSRGKIDIFITVSKEQDDSKSISLNETLAGEYVNALKLLAQRFDLKDDITVSSVARYSDVFDVTYKEDDEEEIKKNVLEVLSEALDGFIKMRETEGQKLACDMLARNAYIKERVKEIEERSPKTVLEYRERLEERIRELISDVNVDEARLLTETAIFADKVAVNEETVRLNSHMEEFDKILAQNEPIGRKLDFLLQEMNRETNTIGSKANDIEIARIVVDIKAELEKIREQLQNLE